MPKHALAIDLGTYNDIGRARKTNEDSIMVYKSPEQIETAGLLSLVADGVGGEARGDHASQMAVRYVGELYYQSALDEQEESFAFLLRNAITATNSKIYAEAESLGLAGHMGTTLVAALIVEFQVHLAWVGDSRIYLVTPDRGDAQQLTTDHTKAHEMVKRGQLTPAQAEKHPDRNVLFRSLGGQPKVEVDMMEGIAQVKDGLLLCSDGLTRYVKPDEIAAYMRIPESAQAIATQLGDLANKRGGKDNISMILLKFQSDDAQKRGPSIWVAAADEDDTQDRVAVPYSQTLVARPEAQPQTAAPEIQPQEFNPTLVARPELEQPAQPSPIVQGDKPDQRRKSRRERHAQQNEVAEYHPGADEVADIDSQNYPYRQTLVRRPDMPFSVPVPDSQEPEQSGRRWLVWLAVGFFVVVVGGLFIILQGDSTPTSTLSAPATMSTMTEALQPPTVEATAIATSPPPATSTVPATSEPTLPPPTTSIPSITPTPLPTDTPTPETSEATSTATANPTDTSPSPTETVPTETQPVDDVAQSWPGDTWLYITQDTYLLELAGTYDPAAQTLQAGSLVAVDGNNTPQSYPGAEWWSVLPVEGTGAGWVRGCHLAVPAQPVNDTWYWQSGPPTTLYVNVDEVWMHENPEPDATVQEILHRDDRVYVITRGEQVHYDGHQWWWRITTSDDESTQGWIEQSSLTDIPPNAPETPEMQ